MFKYTFNLQALSTPGSIQYIVDIHVSGSACYFHPHSFVIEIIYAEIKGTQFIHCLFFFYTTFKMQ